MRCFIGSLLNQADQERVHSLIPKLDDVRWVKPHKYHLTMRFLGNDVEEADLPRYWDCVEKLQDSFPVQVRGHRVDGFPRPSQARVLVLLLEYEACLATLHQGRNPFRPHITLGYAKRKKSVSVPITDTDIDLVIPPPALFESVSGEYRKLEPLAR